LCFAFNLGSVYDSLRYRDKKLSVSLRFFFATSFMIAQRMSTVSISCLNSVKAPFHGIDEKNQRNYQKSCNSASS
jgi:hypothetical protein